MFGSGESTASMRRRFFCIRRGLLGLLWPTRMRALLLDLYDTIARVDFSVISPRLSEGLGVDVNTLFRAFVATKLPRNTGQYRSFAGDLDALAQAAGVRASPGHLSQLADEVTELSKHNVHLYDDVVPTLSRFRAAGIKLAIVSNCDHVTRPVVSALGLGSLVDDIVLSCEVGWCKPDPRIWQTALARLDVPPHEAGFVDDQGAFVAAARAIGLRSFQMLRSADAPRAAGETVVFELASLLTILIA